MIRQEAALTEWVVSALFPVFKNEKEKAMILRQIETVVRLLRSLPSEARALAIREVSTRRRRRKSRKRSVARKAKAKARKVAPAKSLLPVYKSPGPSKAAKAQELLRKTPLATGV